MNIFANNKRICSQTLFELNLNILNNKQVEFKNDVKYKQLQT